MVQPVLTKAVLQLAKTATILRHIMTAHPPPPIPPPPIPRFLLAQDLSSRQIAPTDNI